MARPVRPRREPARAGVPAPLHGRMGRTRRADTQHYHTPTRGRSRAHEPRHPDAGGVGWKLPPSDGHGRPPLLRRWSTCPTPSARMGNPPPLQGGEDVKETTDYLCSGSSSQCWASLRNGSNTGQFQNGRAMNQSGKKGGCDFANYDGPRLCGSSTSKTDSNFAFVITVVHHARHHRGRLGVVHRGGEPPRSPPVGLVGHRLHGGTSMTTNRLGPDEGRGPRPDQGDVVGSGSRYRSALTDMAVPTRRRGGGYVSTRSELTRRPGCGRRQPRRGRGGSHPVRTGRSNLPVRPTGVRRHPRGRHPRVATAIRAGATRPWPARTSTPFLSFRLA